MKKNTILTVYLRADQCASMLSFLEKGESIHPVESELIAKEIRFAVARKECEEKP